MLYKYVRHSTVLTILGLYRDDYTKRLHTREVSRLVGIDVKAVHIHLKRLETEGILSSTIRGKNLEYGLNLNNLTTKYYLILAESLAALITLQKEPAIKKLVDKMNDHAGALILFGSFAKSEAKEDSDIDLLKLTANRETTRGIGDLERIIGREINVVCMAESAFIDGLKKHDPLVLEILSNHVVLKNADMLCSILWDYYAGR